MIENLDLLKSGIFTLVELSSNLMSMYILKKLASGKLFYYSKITIEFKHTKFGNNCELNIFPYE